MVIGKDLAFQIGVKMQIQCPTIRKSRVPAHAVAERPPAPPFPQPFCGVRPAGNLRFDCLRVSAIPKPFT